MKKRGKNSLGSIGKKLKGIKKQERKVMATQQELSEALDGLVGAVADVFAEMNKAFARLQAKIDQGANQVDLSEALAKVTDIHTKLADAIADAQSEAPETTPPPTE